MINRRNFLRSTAHIAGAAALVNGSTLFAKSNYLNRIGIQLYTLRSLMKESVPETLNLVSSLGYKEVEFAGYFDHKPTDVKKMLNQAGLTAPSVHVDLADVRDRLSETIATAEAIGHKFIVVPWLRSHERESLDQFKGYVELFNKVGEECKKAGITFAYHNHEFEFEPLDGVEPYELFLAETDPDLVKMQLDLFWTIKAGRDPITYFKRFPGRFPLCHVKDMAANGDMVNVGKGTIDFGRIFAKSQLAGLKHYFVEHDQPTDARTSAKESITTLKALTF
ncbi:MAG: sugar phosphate isomerase/epimerase family protein [Kordiimonas sp.]